MLLRGQNSSARYLLRRSQSLSRQSSHALTRLYHVTAAERAGQKECDIVIVGGGPAGLAFASALTANKALHGSVEVTLVEGGDLSKVHDWDMPPHAFSNRVVSLTNASLDFLDQIDAWQYVDAARTCPVEDMQVWDGISGSRIDFNAVSLGVGRGPGSTQMARLTETLNLQRGLLRHLSQQPNVTLLDNTKVENIFNDDIPGGGWPMVQLSTGGVLRARLLVGADGINSPVRTYSKIDTYGWDYPTRAIVATLLHPPRTFSPNTTAYQRFLPTGPIAFLPLSPTSSSLVWSTTPALATVLTKADPAILASMINAAFRLPELSVRYLHTRLLEHPSLSPDDLRAEIAFREQAHAIAPYSAHASANVNPDDVNVGIPDQGIDAVPPLVARIQPGTIASFPLRYRHAEAYIGTRTALIGDAAHIVHPLAGQGLNLGLGDAASLARCVGNAVMHGSDIGSHTTLAPYARERYFENHKMMSAVDKLHKLYASTAPPVVSARSIGLEVLNELEALKAGIVGAAGGESNPRSSPSSLWGTVTSGVETLVDGARFAKVVGSGLKSIAGGVLQQVARAAGTGPGEDRRG
ncbi:hypothetical protein B0F90DRAFT_1624426 [Multifurca ochricompacta]|uniref:Ubiquinone biosynthesis monooxygenase COQ6, mitochondrial n=1 Tax=Multifurca ochricompacta TaxID=376703 RepID=A0AAD4MA83_9AGAM|nr:hypothetical protein B0F90DRAFT_1624426 [Multifurca ochricompacta]